MAVHSRTVVDDLRSLGLGPETMPAWTRAASTAFTQLNNNGFAPSTLRLLNFNALSNRASQLDTAIKAAAGESNEHGNAPKRHCNGPADKAIFSISKGPIQEVAQHSGVYHICAPVPWPPTSNTKSCASNFKHKNLALTCHTFGYISISCSFRASKLLAFCAALDYTGTAPPGPRTVRQAYPQPLAKDKAKEKEGPKTPEASSAAAQKYPNAQPQPQCVLVMPPAFSYPVPTQHHQLHQAHQPESQFYYAGSTPPSSSVFQERHYVHHHHQSSSIPGSVSIFDERARLTRHQ